MSMQHFPDSGTGGDSRHRILVIDDNRSIHDDLNKILGKGQDELQELDADESLLFDLTPVRAERFQLDSAYQGQEGLELVVRSIAEENQYSLAFVDIRMPPGWDGVETVEQLWKVDPALQVVICTAYSDYSWPDMHRRLGRSENLLILKKPFDNIEVVQMAHAMSTKWALARQARLRNEELQEEIAERIRAEQELRESEERYRLAARGTNDGLWDWDLQRGGCYFSKRWKEMLGYGERGVGPKISEWLDRVHPEERERLEAQLNLHRRDGGPNEFISEHRMRHADGSYRWMLSRGAVLRSAEGRALRIAGSQTDVTQNKTFDALTSLPNRMLFSEMLTRNFERHQSGAALHFAVMFVDLDRFKHVNDSLGHAAGDQFLIEVARRLSVVVRGGSGRRQPLKDMVARLGGDEFAILLNDVSAASDAIEIADRIQDALSHPVLLDGKPVFTSASIGIALWSPESGSAEEMLRDADLAMYRAKHLGRARSVCFDLEMRQEAIRRLALANDLRLAVAAGEFTVYYQPRMRLQEERLVGFEALVRWRHPVRGLLYPQSFIELAEEIGTIVPIGEEVLRQACRTFIEWDGRIPGARTLDLNVNLSPRQLRDPGLVERIGAILAETGFPGNRLRLEITESALVEDAEIVEAALQALRGMNISLVIDDFGTGYSCLSYLPQLRCESLKIDGSFVAKMSEDVQSLEVVRAIISLTQNLGMSVTAEGIETAGQAAFLAAIGCGYGQGFHFAHPLPAEEAEAWIRRNQNVGEPADGPLVEVLVECDGFPD